jgi:soluble epoxide hydrolase / lipid-phosphate phosphatase
MWIEHLAPISAARAWIGEGRTMAQPAYFGEAHKAGFLADWGRAGSVAAGTTLYQGAMRGINAADDASVPEEHVVLNVPVISIGGTLDPVTLAVQMPFQIEPFAAAGYDNYTVEAGHWLMWEQADEVSSILIDFAGA